MTNLAEHEIELACKKENPNWDEKEENRHTKAMVELTDLIPKVLKKFIQMDIPIVINKLA